MDDVWAAIYVALFPFRHSNNPVTRRRHSHHPEIARSLLLVVLVGSRQHSLLHVVMFPTM
jgi:hypothetical protein